MSQAPHAMYLRAGVKMGPAEMVDTMIKDGLWDAFNGYHMGQTAENVAQKWQISRDEQDAFALASQNKAEAAQKAGRFKGEITPVTIPQRKGQALGIGASAELLMRPSTTPKSMPTPMATSVSLMVIHRPVANSGP